jgi:hypothetical protein
LKHEGKKKRELEGTMEGRVERGPKFYEEKLKTTGYEGS